MKAKEQAVFMQELQDWQNFFILTGTASATLVGLLFVSISIGGFIPKQQAQDYTETFVSPMLLLYAEVLVLSCIAVAHVPTLPLLPVVAGIIGVFIFFTVGRVLRRISLVDYSREDTGATFWIWHICLPCMAGIIFITGSIGFFFAMPLWVLVIALGELLCIMTSLRNTWLLMFWLISHGGKQS